VEKKPIVLTGFMLVGKTRVGKIIAQMLGLEFFDLDELVEKQEGRSIMRIFRENGEPYFREREAEVLKSLMKRRSIVVATGGGTLINEELLNLCKQKTISVHLDASLETILERNKTSKGNRPLLQKDKERIGDLFSFRTEIYAKCDFQIKVDGLKPEQVAAKIIEKLKERNELDQ
jgi:shikimate kinase